MGSKRYGQYFDGGCRRVEGRGQDLGIKSGEVDGLSA